jgi:hypothetical protein
MVLLAAPLAAIRWDLAGRPWSRWLLDPPDRNSHLRWRLEISSVSNGAEAALAHPADVPFPAERLELPDPGHHDLAWTRPRVVLEVEVIDPFAPDVLWGLLGGEHRVRFITGDELVVDRHSIRLRIRASRCH